MIILIVEDEPEIVRLWKELLQPICKEFRVADNLADALKEMAKEPMPDLVILDLRLRGTGTPRESLESIDLFKKIYPGTVVLVLTGNPDQSLPKLASALGADGFEKKEYMVNQDKLLAAVKGAYQRGIESSDRPYERRVRLLETLTEIVTRRETSDTSRA